MSVRGTPGKREGIALYSGSSHTLQREFQVQGRRGNVRSDADGHQGAEILLSAAAIMALGPARMVPVIGHQLSRHLILAKYPLKN